MKRYLFLLFSICFLSSLHAQTLHTINVGGQMDIFAPSSLTIYVGDTVIWNNIGGFHNVNATLATYPNNPEGFGNSVSSSAWAFQWIFTVPGMYNYQCDPHVGTGMIGSISVQAISVPGCTDTLACNFDSLATVDDSSCVYPTTSTTNDTACDIYTWDGVVYDTTGTYTNTYTNVAGCDSTAVLNLIINNSTVNTVYITAIGSYQWPVNGVMYTSSIIDTSIGFNSSGCSEIHILDLTILPNPVDLFFSEHAEGSSDNKYFEIYNPTSDTIDLTNYAFAKVTNSPGNGIGVYEYWIDFDSGAVILPNDVYIVRESGQSNTIVDSIIIAAADMDYGSMSNGDDGIALVYGIEPASPVSPAVGGYIALDWVGDWNGDPGSGWDVAGVNNATRDHTLIRKCAINQGDLWSNSAGINSVNSQWTVLPQDDWSNLGFHNTCLCDSTTNSYISITDTICNGLSITVGNNTYDSTGVYSDTLLAYNGCDSIITTNLTVLNTSASSAISTVTICDGDSALIGTNFYNQSGTYIDSFLTVGGCDSLIITNLVVLTTSNYYQAFTICFGDTIVINSTTYTQPGTYIDTLQTISGCDSLIYTDITIYSQYTISGGIPDNTVGGGGYYSGSQWLELSCHVASELYSAVVYSLDTTLTTFEIRDANGVVLDDVTVNVIPGGDTIYFNYLMSAGGDYQLGVNGSSNALFRNNAGVNYPYDFINDSLIASITSSSAGGNYYYFFYNIKVKPPVSPGTIVVDTNNYYICSGESIMVGGNVYNTTGFYIDTLQSYLGCDSLVFSNLIVNPNVSYNNTKTICSGEVTVVGNSVYDSTGVYVDTLMSWLGCDSIVTTNLTVLSIAGGTTTNNQTICFGDSVSVGNSIYYYDGIYNDTLQDLNGCDSIIITTLVTTSAAYGSLYGGKPDTTNTLGMSGMFSSYNGQLNLDNTLPSILKSAAVYAQDTNSVTFELRDDNGMVLQNITHTVYPGLQRLNFNFLIPIDSNLHLGISMGGSGLYRNNAGNGNSIGYPYNIGPVTIKSANQGSTQYYYFYYDLEIISYGTYIDTTICKEDSVQIGGNTYNTAGTYIDTISTTSSCDSVIYTILDVYQSPPLTITSVPNPPEICLGDSIILEGSAGFTYYWWDNGVVSDRLVDDPTVDTWYLLTAKDSNNCVVKEDIWVYVDSCISGIDYPLVNEFSIYPNPTNGVLNIISDLNIEKISLYSVDGRLIEKTRNTSLFIKTKGIYFIKVKTSKGNIIRRIVVN